MRFPFVKIKNEQGGIFLGMQNETQNLCVTNDHGYVPLVVNTSRSFPHSRLFTEYVPRLARRVPLVEQELPKVC
jgi:expansin (peptidoglycan-binding protein)